jgi:hypothetical protein
VHSIQLCEHATYRKGSSKLAYELACSMDLVHSKKELHIRRMVQQLRNHMMVLVQELHSKVLVLVLRIRS